MTALDKNTISYSDYYEENLYRLQNGVLNIVKASGVPFYLTGGTALSRGYYHHRYSDDLDFFINKDERFNDYADSVINLLAKAGFTWNPETEFIKSPDFYSLTIHSSEYPMGLKIDFVNDISAHFGEITHTPVFERTDSIRNILSNKITAVFRFEGKDIIDIREICRHESFNWDEIFREARQKEIGIEPVEVSQIMKGMPEQYFNKIKWIEKPDWNDFQSDMKKIERDMLILSGNSLCTKAGL